MTLYRAFDAAYPPATPPPDCTVVFGDELVARIERGELV
jgi:hypothetical protein